MEHLNALDRAARYYREALRHVIEECRNDKPRIDHIHDAATRGLRAADHELEAVDAAMASRFRAKGKGAVGDPGCTCVAKPYPYATAYEGNPEGHYVDCPLWGVG